MHCFRTHKQAPLVIIPKLIVFVTEESEPFELPQSIPFRFISISFEVSFFRCQIVFYIYCQFRACSNEPGTVNCHRGNDCP